MLKQLIASPQDVLPLLALVVFFALFVLLGLYVATDRRRTHHQRMAALALESSDQETTGAHHG